MPSSSARSPTSRPRWRGPDDLVAAGRPGARRAPDAVAPATDTASVRAASRAELAREALAEHAPRLLARVRTAARVVRPIGWVLLATAIVLWTGAVALGWMEALVAAVVVTAVLALSVPFLFGRTAYDVDLDLTPHARRRGRARGRRADAHQPVAPGDPALVGRAARGQRAGRLEVPRLAPDAVHEELFAIPTTARGVLAVGPVSVARRPAGPLRAHARPQRRRRPLRTRDDLARRAVARAPARPRGTAGASARARRRLVPRGRANTSPATTCVTCTGARRPAWAR